MTKILSLIFLLLLLPINIVSASTNCDNRYITLVNPVRGRSLWSDQTLKPIQDQYQVITKYNFPATWLLQYDALKDREINSYVSSMDKSQEYGVFLEVSKRLADDAKVLYPYDASWFSPKAIFLSAYSQSERRYLLDQLFSNFKMEFGYYPKSVGAWWIDSYSLDYMKQKYGITSAMIVADQTSTDNYGVWGQWWGIPYYPSKANILSPASSINNKQPVVVIQWAQRDPILGYGKGKASLYSLQANDYEQVGKNTEYFKDIASVYLGCQNPIGQITVGLETGMESIGFLDEYKNQLGVLKAMDGVKAVTMSEFSNKFAEVYPDFPKEGTIIYQNSKWLLTEKSRENDFLRDKINYQNNIAFKDYFLADKTNFLDRTLNKLPIRDNEIYAPWFFLIILLAGIAAVLKKQMKLFILATVFLFAVFGLLLRSSYQFGWQIFYGPALSNLVFWQIAVVIVSYIILWLLYRSEVKRFIWYIPLSFAIDVMIQFFRYSFISGKYYLGFSTDTLHFIGITYQKPINIHVVNLNLESFLAAGLWRLDLSRYWSNQLVVLVFYPLIHILLGLILGWLLIKIPIRIRLILILILITFLYIHLVNIFQADPRLVQ